MFIEVTRTRPIHEALTRLHVYQRFISLCAYSAKKPHIA